MANKLLAERVLPLIDLTSLNDADTDEVITALCTKAVTPYGNVAAVCVYPRFVKLAKKSLTPTAIKIATVTNFPTGTEPLDAVLNQTKMAIAAGANEIDLVIPYRSYLAGDHQLVKDYIAQSKSICGSTILLKVILETGALLDAEIISAVSQSAIDAGADFLKTSTGKIQVGATLAAATAMLEVIKASRKPVGLKISGGIRTLEQAAEYLSLADKIMGNAWVSAQTFRFGASTLIDDVLLNAK
jgi:deoxyribose-phosphate aldolase